MFILADTEERCVLVTVYYVDISTSVSLGDMIEIPKPVYHIMNIEWKKEVGFFEEKNQFMEFLFWIEIFNSIDSGGFTEKLENQWQRLANDNLRTSGYLT